MQPWHPSHLTPISGNGTGWLTAARTWLIPTLLALLTWWSSSVSYLLGHTLAELFSMVVAGTALVVATTSLHFTRNHFVVFVAVAIGWCSGLDLIHTLVFKGMHLLPVDSANPSAQLWIAARSMQAVALLCAPWLLRRSVRVSWLHLGFGSWSALCVWLIFSGYFPTAYIDGQGLTPFKIGTEYLIITLLGLALLRMWRQRALMSTQLFVSMSAATLAMMASEFAFTQYVSVYAQSNLIGHLLKIYAYWFAYLALVQTTLNEPFDMLARAASTYDAVPDPTLIVSTKGRILQANQAAARDCGVPAEQLVGQSSHALFHDPSVSTGHCPVCLRLPEPGVGFTHELDLPGDRAKEYSLAPFHATGEAQAWVQIVRDISERRRLAREREALVNDLHERIKELHCLTSVAELGNQKHLTIPELLRAVLQTLPPAFVAPNRLQAALSSDWGHFGAALPDPMPAQHQVVDITLDSQRVGRLHAWYPDDVAASGLVFLAEEITLLQTVARHVGDMLSGRLSAERVQRLSYVYELLSATNRAVVHSNNRDELWRGLFQALLAHGTFPIFFIATTDDGQLPLRLVRQHGLPDGRLPDLAQLLAHPDSPLLRHWQHLADCEVMVNTLGADNTSQITSQAEHWDAWTRHLQAHDVTQGAQLPLRCDGCLQGMVGLYARGLSTFDAEQLRLLDQMAGDISFALDTLANRARRQAAEQHASLMAHRFEELFKSSPLPMQIYSLHDQCISAINQAHHRWLGYELHEIGCLPDWLTCVYPDADLRGAVATDWQQAIEAAKRGQTVSSHELRLQCKDGSHRIARGTMTVVGDDAIVAWTDLTNIRQSEQSLRDSEQRFRSMVEQTISAMYVRRDGKFIYVNPSFCELMGRPAHELLGQDVLRFTRDDPDNLQRIRRAWQELHTQPVHQVSYQAPVRRQDGKLLELALSAKLITWDDGLPATIVIAQDISERKHAEERINAYVRQLEASMRGTLQAVSKMVEMRDPYTAGHERRVGLIASALARELGWSAERCDNLEMLGLVHDIGKIAVPSEILTKPTRLSRLEMGLMQGHAEAGYDILKDVPFPTPVAEIILQHHERLDGSGYPRGLKGDAILPEARVLAVADVIESISSHRPYRPALGVDAALEELQSHAGTLYDPDVVNVAVRLIRQQGYVLPD